MSRFDNFVATENGGGDSDPVPTVEVPLTNGTTHGKDKKRSPDGDSVLSDVEDTPPKKKQKKHRSIEDDDAAFAAKLQAEENLRSRARSTRGGNTKKKAPLPKKKKEKKKSANRVKDEDDSDLGSGSGVEKKSPNQKSGFHVSLARQ
jgi:upstream activation factor subunit UAF30